VVVAGVVVVAVAAVFRAAAEVSLVGVMAAAAIVGVEAVFREEATEVAVTRAAE
jgi:hypothetical protein